MLFTDENIENIFGAEDAENESKERLKEYFLRNKAYESLRKPYFSAVDVIEFLYKIDFITARREQTGSEKIVRLHFDDSPHIISSAADFGFHWEVHPAYRWALTPGDTPFIISATELEASD